MEKEEQKYGNHKLFEGSIDLAEIGEGKDVVISNAAGKLCLLKLNDGEAVYRFSSQNKVFEIGDIITRKGFIPKDLKDNFDILRLDPANPAFSVDARKTIENIQERLSKYTKLFIEIRTGMCLWD